NDTLSGQREQVAQLQRSWEIATQDAAEASARVARVADAAIDAERRLTAGIANGEQNWGEQKREEQDAAAGRFASSVAQRIEGTLPDLARMVTDKLTAYANP